MNKGTLKNDIQYANKKVFDKYAVQFCREDVATNKTKILKSDLSTCKEACVDNEWCKSFDFCKKDHGQSFCHLKDKSRDSYRKEFSFSSNSDYYECRSDGKNVHMT